MKKTIENCSLIKKGVKLGEGIPRIYKNENAKQICEGYQIGWNDDEPCDQCKKCKHKEFYESEVE